KKVTQNLPYVLAVINTSEPCDINCSVIFKVISTENFCPLFIFFMSKRPLVPPVYIGIIRSSIPSNFKPLFLYPLPLEYAKFSTLALLFFLLLKSFTTFLLTSLFFIPLKSYHNTSPSLTGLGYSNSLP